jgi:hypothetical protein
MPFLFQVSRLASFTVEQKCIFILCNVLTFVHLAGDVIHANFLNDVPDCDVDEEADKLVVHD